MNEGLAIVHVCNRYAGICKNVINRCDWCAHLLSKSKIQNLFVTFSFRFVRGIRRNNGTAHAWILKYRNHWQRFCRLWPSFENECQLFMHQGHLANYFWRHSQSHRPPLASKPLLQVVYLRASCFPACKLLWDLRYNGTQTKRHQVANNGYVEVFPIQFT